MKKYLLPTTIVLIILSSFLLLPKDKDQQVIQNDSIEQTAKKEATTSIFFGEERIIKHQIKINENTTAYEALVKTLEKEGLEIQTTQYDFGIFINSIDGIKNTNDKAWIYFVNGESANKASDQFILKDEDLLEWKFIKPEY